MDRGAWWATVHGVTKSWTRLNTAHTVQAYEHTVSQLDELYIHRNLDGLTTIL